jgi:type I restriction enzyme M protein
MYDEETQKALDISGGDEEFAAFPQHHSFQIPEGAHWIDVRSKTADVGAAINNALRAIEKENVEKLAGVFGAEARWTDKELLPDRVLKNLIEHFSTRKLTLEVCPEDEFGQGYEYMIKRFADDAGHTAQEFYTNRTVVHLMTELLKPDSGESIYDPTCGTGGMLISCIAHLKRNQKEWRNVRAYGQETIPFTAAIARMNLFLHGITAFSVECDDTLVNPKFIENGMLQKFDVVLANPPYSIKDWNREAFAYDKYGRNMFGTPPQGRADYAFIQHIFASMKPGSGRCAILLPHGVLFREEEKSIRENLIKSDLLECVIGLGPNLFYNASMEACIMICRTSKPASRKNKVLFINAINEVVRKNAQSFLEEDHIKKIADAYEQFGDVQYFAKAASYDEIAAQEFNLNINRYVEREVGPGDDRTLEEHYSAWRSGSDRARVEIEKVKELIGGDLS